MNASNERVAIVAGAGGELGGATAARLAAVGFTVVGVDRSEERLKELPDSIRRDAADQTYPAAARSVVDRIATRTARAEENPADPPGRRVRAGYSTTSTPAVSPTRRRTL